MFKLQVVHSQLNKESLCFFFKHTHTHTQEEKPLDAQREKVKKKQTYSPQNHNEMYKKGERNEFHLLSKHL